MNASPVIIFVYNREAHGSKVIEALAKCNMAKDSDVFIYSDGPKNKNQEDNVARMRKYLNNVDKTQFRTLNVICAPNNKGLAKSIISGVSEVMEKYGRAIVLEDDAVPAVNFLEYMNACLEYYKDNDKIWAIGGYLVPVKIPENEQSDVFLALRGSSCAWGTWSDRWKSVDWDCTYYKAFRSNLIQRHKFNKAGSDMSIMLDRQMRGRIDSWAIRFAYARFQKDAFWVMPYVSKIFNIGFDSSGTHSGCTDKFDSVKLDKSCDRIRIDNAAFNPETDKIMRKHYALDPVTHVRLFVKTNVLKR